MHETSTARGSDTEHRIALLLDAQRGRRLRAAGAVLVSCVPIITLVGGLLAAYVNSVLIVAFVLAGMAVTGVSGVALFGAGFHVRRRALRELATVEARRLPPARIVK